MAGKLAALPPPEIPPALVVLKLDPVSRNVHFDQEPLRQVLKKLRDYTRDINSRSIATLQIEVDTQMSNTKREVGVSIAEITQAAEARFALKARLQQLEESMSSAREQLTFVENKQNKMAEKLNSTLEKIMEGGPPASSSSITPRTMSMLVDTRQGPPAEVEAGASGQDPSALPTRRGGARMATMRNIAALSVTVQNANNADFVSMADFKQVEDAIKAIQDEIESWHGESQLLEGRMEEELAVLVDRLARMDEAIKSQAGKVDPAQLAPLEAKAAELAAAWDDVKRRLDELPDLLGGKCDCAVVESIRAELVRLRVHLDQAAMAAAVEPRLDSLEKGVRLLEAASRQSVLDVEALRQSAADLGTRIDHSNETTAGVARHAEASLLEQCALLAAQDRANQQLLAAAEVRISELSRRMEDMALKATKIEVAELRTSLSLLAEELKDKEQSVLFGARCLSCNRVFDDVQPTSGAVDLRAERQRAQVLAEIQRALHLPSADHSNPIKMLAVKVGRPTSIGAFAGRDAASPACAVEDVQLLPVRNLTSAGGVGGRLSTPRQLLSSSPRSSAMARATTAEGAGLGTLSSGRLQSSPKEGPLDFKHPLNELLGRSEGRSKRILG